MADFYSLLGLTRTASHGDVKAAFRKAALEHHPDKHVQDSQGTRDLSAQRFKAISEAYQTLGNETKRRMYDMTLRYGSGSGRGGSGQYSAPQYQQYQGQQNPFYRAQTSTSGTAYRAPEGFARRSFWSAFKMFSRGMTRGDAYFHLLLAGCVIGGTLAAQSVGSTLWESNNRGKSFEDIIKRKAEGAAAASIASAPGSIPQRVKSEPLDANEIVSRDEAVRQQSSGHDADVDAEMHSLPQFSGSRSSKPAGEQVVVAGVTLDSANSTHMSIDAVANDNVQSAAGPAAVQGDGAHLRISSPGSSTVDCASIERLQTSTTEGVEQHLASLSCPTGRAEEKSATGSPGRADVGTKAHTTCSSSGVDIDNARL